MNKHKTTESVKLLAKEYVSKKNRGDIVLANQALESLRFYLPDSSDIVAAAHAIAGDVANDYERALRLAGLHREDVAAECVDGDGSGWHLAMSCSGVRKHLSRNGRLVTV